MYNSGIARIVKLPGHRNPRNFCPRLQKYNYMHLMQLSFWVSCINCFWGCFKSPLILKLQVLKIVTHQNNTRTNESLPEQMHSKQFCIWGQSSKDWSWQPLITQLTSGKINCTPIKVYRQNINAQQYTVIMTPWSNFGWGFMIKFPPRRWSGLLFNHKKQSSSESWRVWHSHSLTKLWNSRLSTRGSLTFNCLSDFSAYW